MNQEAEKPSIPWSFSPPVAALVVGILLIGASFLPVGNWAARSQWSREDSAEYDKISAAYKQSAYESPTRKGRTPAEWDAERDRMRVQMESFQQRLDRAKSQPKLWTRGLLVAGILLTAFGFFASSATRS